ncbi:MAG TPA: DciA family protein [Arenimonas sp.]|nr:DciA family protein [Arenimonas sp.]
MITFTMSTPGKSKAPGAARSRSALEAATDPGLARVIERAQWLDALDQRLRQTLPAALAAQVRLANVSDKTLVFLASSPVWKARLLQATQTLESAADAAGLPGRALLVKVSPAAWALPAPAPSGKPLSEAARASLRATAQSIADPDLRAQLLRLASKG